MNKISIEWIAYNGGVTFALWYGLTYQNPGIESLGVALAWIVATAQILFFSESSRKLVIEKNTTIAPREANILVSFLLMGTSAYYGHPMLSVALFFGMLGESALYDDWKKSHASST